MELFYKFFENFWHFSTLISFFIIFGLIVAGVLKQIIPDGFIQKHMGKNSSNSIFKSALIGIPLPLCSCSVIPFASSLKKSGASKSALQTFLISTPITGVDSIMATFGAFGWFFTIYRVIASVFISILAGFLSMIFIKEDSKASNMNWSTTKPTILKNSQPIDKNASFLNRVFEHAFNQLFSSIAKPLLIGILLGSILSSLIPADMTALLSDNLIVSYIFVLLMSMPLYVCAITSIPIGITLILTGFSPGAAFVFLTAGPATSIVSITVVGKILSKKSLIIYLGSIIFGTMLFAYIMDTAFIDLLADVQKSVHHKDDASLLEIASTVAMFFLFYKYIFASKAKQSCCL